MSIFVIRGVKISGIASAVPMHFRTIQDDIPIFGKNETSKISQSIGVNSRHIAPPHLCTSDICYFAAKSLLNDACISRDSIDALIFVSQTPDYRLPATSCILQNRLGFRTECAAFDLNMGCSGYVYGLWVASTIIAAGNAQQVLLLVGDTSSKLISSKDRSTSLLFGDSGTATLLSKTANDKIMYFNLGTDGSGYNNLIIPAGGCRNPSNESTRIAILKENGNLRSDEHLYMNGAEVFAFTLQRVPPMIDILLKYSKYLQDDIDYYIFHQANKFIVDYLAKKMKLPVSKVPINTYRYGNTSSASIPLILTDILSKQLKTTELKLVFSGFGVGYSWGSVCLDCGPIVIPDIILVP